MSNMKAIIMDFITEFYNKHSIYIYIENLTKIEMCIFYQMIKHKVSIFELRFRESQYNKEEYKVGLSHAIFNPECLDKDELFIDLRVLIVNEADVVKPFSKYAEERKGEIFKSHNWDMINKSQVERDYYSL